MRLKAIPTPAELIKAYSLSEAHCQFIAHSRKTIQNILNGIDKRQLIIVGPCSIHDVDSTLEYADKLRVLAEEVKDQFFIIMRSYLEKPRTNIGWKGFISDPYLDGSNDIGTGLILGRKLLLAITDMEIPLGCELLELTTHYYISDLLSWGCIGARTTTSQPHRLLASSLDFPVGFKNTTDGNVDNSINAILAANTEHSFLGLNALGQISKIQTLGNPYCHVVLRGQENRINYDRESIKQVRIKIKKAGLPQRLIIDCSHDNCSKIHLQQINSFQSIMHQIAEGNTPIVGLMLESHLYEGSQITTDQLRYGVSITDPCLDWETTSEIIREAYYQLSTQEEIAISRA